MADLRVPFRHISPERLFKLRHPVRRNIIHHVMHRRIQDHHLVRQIQWLILSLPEHRHQCGAVGQPFLRGRIHIGPELGEGLEFPVLRQNKLDLGRHLLHGLRLGLAADTGHGNTCIDGRPLSGEEQIRFQEDLPVGDGNDIRRNVRRDIPRLGLNQRNRSHGPAAQFIGKPGRPFQQPAVQVENISRIRLSSRRSLQQQGHGPVRHRMLAQIIINDQYIFPAVHEIFSQCASRIRCNVLHRCSGTGCGGYHRCVFHGAPVRQGLYQLGHGGLFLSDGHVDTDHILSLLVQDRIHCQRRFPGLPVSDDQLTLTLADRHHGIDGLDAGLHRFRHRLPVQHPRRRAFHRPAFFRFHRAFPVNRTPQGVHHTADHVLPHRHLYNGTGRFHNIPFADGVIIS